MKKNINSIQSQSNFQQFHHRTKNMKNEAAPSKTSPFFWSRMFYKEYPRFPRILLPANMKEMNSSLENVLKSRHSDRNLKNKSFSLRQLSRLFSLSCGFRTLGKDHNRAWRTYPSAGARFPLEIYPVFIPTKHTNTIFGIYHYNLKCHALEKLPHPFERKSLHDIFLKANHSLIDNAALILFISSIFDRTTVKYGDRGYRYVHLEAGHLAQNFTLVATALNIKSCCIGGYIDDTANDILHLPAGEEVIYAIAFG